MDHLNANMEGEIVEGEIVEGGIAEAMEGEIAEAMEGEIAEAEGEAVEAVGDAIGEAEEERRRLEREARNEAASLVLQGVAEAPVQLGDHLMEDVDKEENHPQILFDHVNEEALGELATREVSKVLRLSNGSGPTWDLLVQCGRNRLPCGARAYKTVYFEESLMVALKKKGRRRTGGADGDQKNPGVASGHMAASTFMLPRWLRDVARAGLRNHYTFDLENCRPTLIAARHDSAFLKNFVAERNAILAKTHPDRTAAKELYLRLLYGGSIENWVKAHEMTTFPMMDYALEFQRTVRALVAEDCSKNRDVLKRLRDETARPRELLCYVLNTAQERELIDRVVNVGRGRARLQARRSLLGVRGRFGPAPQRDQVRAGRVRFHAEATALGSERARGGRNGDLQERRPAHSESSGMPGTSAGGSTTLTS